MESLNWVDFLIIGVITLSALVSLIRGLIPEVLSLATWIAAFAIAMKFFPATAPQFEQYLSNETFRNVGAFAAIFVAVLIVGALINYLIGSMVKATGFKATDRILGIAFGVARGALVIALMVLGLGLTKIPEESWWQQSSLMPHFEKAAVWLRERMPENVRNHFEFDDSKPAVEPVIEAGSGIETQPIASPDGSNLSPAKAEAAVEAGVERDNVIQSTPVR